MVLMLQISTCLCLLWTDMEERDSVWGNVVVVEEIGTRKRFNFKDSFPSDVNINYNVI